MNAIYLKANWSREFDVSETASATFTRQDGDAVDAKMMSLQGQQDVPYARGTGWKATELRYLGAGRTTPLAMTLILPDDLAAFEAGLSGPVLDQVTAAIATERKRLDEVTVKAPPMEGDCGTYPYSLKLFMPRFGIDTKASLRASVAALGMERAFDPDLADFSGITGDKGLYIGDVIHQANIDVDEKGTKAAAATAVVMDTGGCTGPLPAKDVTLRLDHPFIFVLRDIETGAVLFMGRVMDPTVRA